jgi:hypothetical protein
LAERFKVHAVAKDDSKSIVNAKELIITLGDRKELKISLLNYMDQGELTMFTEHASIIVRPGACNLLRISLERHQESCGADEAECD